MAGVPPNPGTSRAREVPLVEGRWPSHRGGWRVEVASATARVLHHQDLGEERLARLNLPDGPALVLGSTQVGIGSELLGRPAAEVVRRRSGGGAVWLSPDAQAWVDLVIPADDPLWCRDVGESARWVGEAWCRALETLVCGPGDGGVTGCWEVWSGPMVDRPAGRRACFAGLAPGEVVCRGAGGRARKVVGVSQRRTRGSARFQCVAYLRWDPEPLLDALAGLPDPDGVRDRVAAALRRGVATVPAAGPGALFDALLRALP